MARSAHGAIEGGAPVAPGEEAHLQVPSPGVAGELVDEDERRARSRFPVVELDPVNRCTGHGGSPGSCSMTLARETSARGVDVVTRPQCERPPV
jgi:hypothetical protein